MIGLDTNVLLAWVLAGQSWGLPESAAYRLSLVVLVELAWVLARTMKYRKDAICKVMDELMQASNLEIDRREIVELALEDYRRGPAGFADYLIVHENEAAGCRTTLTFDKDAGRHRAFTLLKD